MILQSVQYIFTQSISVGHNSDVFVWIFLVTVVGWQYVFVWC